ncbi:dapper 1-like [Latimeria chalumnae]|uniref:dapper 1-like n=1 Tax=Latimeria chalumnae TaxID=7897 RepID=UPI0006D9079B|nr:PREDICTED: dapper 1-like [Latimeria chalumnae]|eukprot:XP_006008028.2 PREDICTED: dapper 1-like [Latimeria chalumnae]
MDTFSYPSPLHAVAMQSPMLCQPTRGNVYNEKSFSPSSLLCGYTADFDGEVSCSATSHGEFQPYTESTHSRKVENYIMGLIQKRNYLVRSSKPRTSLNSEPLKGLARQNSLCIRHSEVLGTQSNNCELKYPQSERANISSPYSYEGNGLSGKCRPQWNPGTEKTQANKNIQNTQTGETYTMLVQQQRSGNDLLPPHLLKKQPKLIANVPPLRPTSLEYYELNYQASLNSPQENHSFEHSLKEISNIAQLGKSASPRNGHNSAEIHSPSYEEKSEVRSKRSPPQSMDEGLCQMVNAQYIPAQQPTKAQAANRSVRNKSGSMNKNRPIELSPDRGPQTPREKPKAMPKKCRFSEEAESAKKGARKASPRSKKTCRSQSENSLLNKQGVIEKAAPKYNTVDRDEPIAGKPPRQRRQNGGNYRKWRSTVEICQDEAAPSDSYGAQKRGKKPHRPPAQPHSTAHGPRSSMYGYAESDSEYSADCGSVRCAPVCEPEDDLSSYTMNCFGDSESSLSEVESPGFSTCSSDTDESGGLVWPQQVPPQLVASSGSNQSSMQPKVFVKIKASHALKKKIMRFRTGSLKVMTTV